MLVPRTLLSGSSLHPLFLCFVFFVCMPFCCGAYLWDALQGFISLFIISRASIARPPREPEPPAILSTTPNLGWTPLSCGRSGCRQINSILGGWEFDRSHGAGTSSPSYWQQVEEQAPKPDLWVGRCVSSWWPWFPSRSSVLIYMYIYIYACTFLIRVLL